MTVALTKPPIREELPPLWWDDASYIAYQSYDGPHGEATVELSFLPHQHSPLAHSWVSYEDEPDFSSRRWRKAYAAIDRIAAELYVDGLLDRAHLEVARPIPF